MLRHAATAKLASGLTISRCRDGKIEEEWEIVDVTRLLEQIGQLPEPSAV